MMAHQLNVVAVYFNYRYLIPVKKSMIVITSVEESVSVRTESLLL